MFTSLDVSTSGLVAQRARLDVISSNLANISTTRNEKGEIEPYQARFVTFQTDEMLTTQGGGSGVKVTEIGQSYADPVVRYDPQHPDADENGNVLMPNINMTKEFVDALQATRAYEANIGVMEITKDLGQQTLQIIA